MGGRGDYWGTKSSWDQMNHPEDSRDKIVNFFSIDKDPVVVESTLPMD